MKENLREIEKLNKYIPGRLDGWVYFRKYTIFIRNSSLVSHGMHPPKYLGGAGIFFCLNWLGAGGLVTFLGGPSWFGGASLFPKELGAESFSSSKIFLMRKMTQEEI